MNPSHPAAPRTSGTGEKLAMPHPVLLDLANIPNPVIVTTGDDVDYLRACLYSYYTTITERGSTYTLHLTQRGCAYARLNQMEGKMQNEMVETRSIRCFIGKEACNKNRVLLLGGPWTDWKTSGGLNLLKPPTEWQPQCRCSYFGVV